MWYDHLCSNLIKFIPIFLILILAEIIVFFALWIRYNRSLKSGNRGDYLDTTFGSLKYQIKLALIRYGGIMRQREIADYLDIPEDLLVQKLKEMEQEGIIYRANSSDLIYLK